jgi:hypothetical protein
MYDKMWLQPIAAVVAFVGLAMAALPASPLLRVGQALCAALLAAEVAANCAWAVPEAGREAPYLRDAREVDAVLRPVDLLIYEWDGVSVCYSEFYGFGRPKCCFPTRAHEKGEAVLGELRQMIQEADARGGRAYFLGVLDLDEPGWHGFLGGSFGLPYDCLDEYRARCRPVATFRVQGRQVTLRVYEAAAGR